MAIIYNGTLSKLRLLTSAEEYRTSSFGSFRTSECGDFLLACKVPHVQVCAQQSMNTLNSAYYLYCFDIFYETQEIITWMEIQPTLKNMFTL